jgi:hypothetical protein
VNPLVVGSNPTGPIESGFQPIPVPRVLVSMTKNLRIEPPKPPYWRQKYYYAGKEKLISHGVYPQVPLKLARKRRADAKAVLDAGGDPSAHRKAQKAAKRNAANNTFEELALEWYSKRAKSWAASNADKILGRLRTPPRISYRSRARRWPSSRRLTSPPARGGSSSRASAAHCAL